MLRVYISYCFARALNGTLDHSIFGKEIILSMGCAWGMGRDVNCEESYKWAIFKSKIEV
jgi:hypothetical protein